MSSWHDTPQSSTQDLSSRQHKALAALLTTSTIENAAKEAGVHRRTLHRWLSEDASFRAAYKEQRKSMLDSVIGLLQSTSFKAVEVLSKALDSRNENARIRAALGALDFALRASELDLTDRIEVLEEAQRREELEQRGAW